jgi:hypothetical protein
LPSIELTDCPVVAYCLTKTIIECSFTVLKGNFSSPMQVENYESRAQSVGSVYAQRQDQVLSAIASGVSFKSLID